MPTLHEYDWGAKGWHEPAGLPDKPYAPGVPIVSGKYRGARRLKITGKSKPVVRATVESNNGWHRGYAWLNGVKVYHGNATRSRDEAWEYARRTMNYIKEGLAYGTD